MSDDLMNAPDLVADAVETEDADRGEYIACPGDAFGAEALADITGSAETFIVFGDGNRVIEDLPPIAVPTGAWERHGSGRLMPAVEPLLDGMGLPREGVSLQHVGLMASIDGPVIAACEIPGGVRLLPGRRHVFPKGSFLF